MLNFRDQPRNDFARVQAQRKAYMLCNKPCGVSNYRTFALYKPYDVLSQFTQAAPGHRTLADVHGFAPGVYPVGRLDRDSEGLLLLTSDPRINGALLHPRNGHTRTYLAHVEGTPTNDALQRLREGVDIRIDKRPMRTRPAIVRMLANEPELPPRNPPIRFRKTVPTAWIELQLTEGKNRQVRRMCAAVGLPVLRLVRTAIARLTLGTMQPGDVRELSEQDIDQQLGLTLTSHSPMPIHQRSHPPKR